MLPCFFLYEVDKVNLFLLALFILWARRFPTTSGYSCVGPGADFANLPTCFTLLILFALSTLLTRFPKTKYVFFSGHRKTNTRFCRRPPPGRPFRASHLRDHARR